MDEFVARNSAKASRASLILLVGPHSKIHFGQNDLTTSPVVRHSTERLKLRLCPGGISLASQLMGCPKPATEIAMRVAWKSLSESLVWNHVSEFTSIVRCRALSTTISRLPHHPPSYNEVMTLADSSKVSLLFFYKPLFGTLDHDIGNHIPHQRQEPRFSDVASTRQTL